MSTATTFVYSGGSSLTLPSQGGVQCRYVKFYRTSNDPGNSGVGDNYVLNVSDIEVYDSKGTNIAKQSTPSMSSQWSGGGNFPAANLINGNLGDFAHTDYNDLLPWMMLDLGSMQTVYAMRIISRTDCCTYRLIGCNLDLLDARKTKVYTSDTIKSSGIAYVFAPPSTAVNAGSTDASVANLVPVLVQWAMSCSVACGDGTQTPNAICIPGKTDSSCPAPVASPCNLGTCPTTTTPPPPDTTNPDPTPNSTSHGFFDFLKPGMLRIVLTVMAALLVLGILVHFLFGSKKKHSETEETFFSLAYDG